MADLSSTLKFVAEAYERSGEPNSEAKLTHCASHLIDRVVYMRLRSNRNDDENRLHRANPSQ